MQNSTNSTHTMPKQAAEPLAVLTILPAEAPKEAYLENSWIRAVLMTRMGLVEAARAAGKEVGRQEAKEDLQVVDQVTD